MNKFNSLLTDGIFGFFFFFFHSPLSQEMDFSSVWQVPVLVTVMHKLYIYSQISHRDVQLNQVYPILLGIDHRLRDSHDTSMRLRASILPSPKLRYIIQHLTFNY